MPKIKANNLTINYEQQGSGEPLILVPYLAADNACYAFQVAEYAKHFTCISLDLRGTGESDKHDGAYSTEDLADDVAAFMRAIGIAKAHVAGLSQCHTRVVESARYRLDRIRHVLRRRQMDRTGVSSALG